MPMPRRAARWHQEPARGSASLGSFCVRPAPCLLSGISSEEKESHLIAQTPQGSGLVPVRLKPRMQIHLRPRGHLFFSHSPHRTRRLWLSRLQDAGSGMLSLLPKAAMAGDLSYSLRSQQRLDTAHSPLRSRMLSQTAFQETIP